jgi:hypothetical protein
MNESIIQNERILTLRIAASSFALHVAFPSTNEKPQWGPRISLGIIGLLSEQHLA